MEQAAASMAAVQPGTGQPSLIVDAELGASGVRGVGVHRLSPELMRSLADYLDAGGWLAQVLQVRVVQPRGSVEDCVPAMLGQHQVLESGVRFVPCFPFEPGVRYLAAFDRGSFCHSGSSDVLTLAFSLPRDVGAAATSVTQIYPSRDALPENLLRFYVGFSNAMERGRAETEIRLLGPDGAVVPDALYRAPVELWDRGMRVLTILLDPGRLKRGVGPNRELGPPLQAGRTYTLVIGAGMTDRFGRALDTPVFKRFSVIAPVREHVAIEDWTMLLPQAGSRQPLSLEFSKSLDWAMLLNAVTVASASGETVGGRIAVEQFEQRWALTPDEPWAAGCYQVRVVSVLEDPCGNNLSGPFDRPLRAERDLPGTLETRSVPFVLSEPD